MKIEDKCSKAKNLDKINSVKRDQVKKIIKHVEENDDIGLIKKIIIFGSSTRSDCTEKSDIDICVVSSLDSSKLKVFKHMYIVGAFSDVSGENCDTIEYKYADSFLRNTIDTNGVCVYEL